MESPEQRRKRQFDYMTSAVLKEREGRLLASVHFTAWGNLVFVISATITLIQGGLATMAQAKLSSSDHAQSLFNVTIALLAAFSVFWQSLIQHWDYSGKACLHDSAASALEKIYNVALLKAREEHANAYGTTGGDEDEDVKYAIRSGDVERGGGTNNKSIANIEGEEEEDEGNVSKDPSDNLSLTKQFEQAIEGCNSQVPVQIAAAFETLDTRIGICNKKIFSTGQSEENTTSHVAWEKVYPALYRELTTTIISQRGWPYFLPNAERIVDKTIEKFQKRLKSDGCLLESLLHRNREIYKLYEACESTTLL